MHHLLLVVKYWLLQQLLLILELLVLESARFLHRLQYARLYEKVPVLVWLPKEQSTSLQIVRKTQQQ